MKKQTIRDYYEILEVKRTADKATIKRAFLKKARYLHPDVSTEPEAEKLFKELNEAYSVLSDERKRALYDRFGTVDEAALGQQSPFSGAGFDDAFSGFGFGGFGDIFQDMFGGASTHYGSARRRSGTRPQTDEELHVQMDISIADILAGTKRTFSFSREVACSACDGTGSVSKQAPSVCTTCEGIGQVRRRVETPMGIMDVQSACPACGGAGHIIEDPCPVCGGAATVRRSQTLQVRISGQDISDEGHEG